MLNSKFYNKYSEYLKSKYGEKVYKLPINLPITCPNRIENSGCSFCSDIGTGFEASNNTISVVEQLNSTKSKIQTKYKANKFIAYFQNFTNTFLPLEEFKRNIEQALSVSDIVELSISTRPDCITIDYLEILKTVALAYNVSITIELGLQTVNYHTLQQINRGHGLAEFIDAVLLIRSYSFTICTHVILNLPYDNIDDNLETAKILSALKIDLVKIHSLYIAQNSVLCELYKNGTITICSKEEYLHRLIVFLEYLNPNIIIERLFSRIPEADSVFSNWSTSWWKLQDELLALMEERQSYQGKQYHYLNGAALRKLV